MKSIATAVLAAALTSFAAPANAVAATPQEQFLSTLAKIAPFAPAKAKRLCRCTEPLAPGVGELRADYLAHNGIEDYTVVCIIPHFDPSSGGVLYTTRCGEFEILPK